MTPRPVASLCLAAMLGLAAACGTPARAEGAPPDFDPGLKLEHRADGWYLTVSQDGAWATQQSRSLVTTERLGKALVPGCSYENPDVENYTIFDPDKVQLDNGLPSDVATMLEPYRKWSLA